MAIVIAALLPVFLLIVLGFGIGLLVTGAGLHLEGMFRPSLAASVAVFLKLILMPLLAIALALWFGLSEANRSTGAEHTVWFTPAPPATWSAAWRRGY